MSDFTSQSPRVPPHLLASDSERSSEDPVLESDTTVSEEFHRSDQTGCFVNRIEATTLQDELREIFSENVTAKVWRVAVRELEQNVITVNLPTKFLMLTTVYAESAN